MRHTLPAGVVGPGFNDEFGDVFGIIYGVTADGFTHRELRDRAEGIRDRLKQVPDVAKIEILGAQDEKIFVGLPPGPARRAFTSLMSLLPGTVPTGVEREGGLLIHCLDVEPPVAAQLAEQEGLFVKVIDAAPRNG
jgi:hypothetical protein